MSFLATIRRRLRFGAAKPPTEYDADIKRCKARIADCRDALPHLTSADRRMWTLDALRKAEARLQDLERRQAAAQREAELVAMAKRRDPQRAANPHDPYANDAI